MNYKTVLVPLVLLTTFGLGVGAGRLSSVVPFSSSNDSDWELEYLPPTVGVLDAIPVVFDEAGSLQLVGKKVRGPFIPAGSPLVVHVGETGPLAVLHSLRTEGCRIFLTKSSPEGDM